MKGKRKMAQIIKCPECGEEFKKPLFGEKKHGIGWTIGAIGDYTCPQCKYKGASSSFVEVEN
jgi:ribosomal protein L37AE/L43A